MSVVPATTPSTTVGGVRSSTLITDDRSPTCSPAPAEVARSGVKSLPRRYHAVAVSPSSTAATSVTIAVLPLTVAVPVPGIRRADLYQVAGSSGSTVSAEA